MLKGACSDSLPHPKKLSNIYKDLCVKWHTQYLRSIIAKSENYQSWFKYYNTTFEKKNK